MRWLLTLVATLALAPAAHAQGASIQGFDVPPDSGRWEPADVQVKVGEPVTWHWEGTSSPHNVKSAAWAATEGDTTPFTHTFTSPGVYSFRCQFHTAMTGTVTVADAAGTPPPPPPPPPLSEQWWQNDQQPPTAVEVADALRPRLSRVRATTIRGGARVRFRLSERARVEVRLELAGLTIKTARGTFRAGRRSLTIRDRRLEGTYRVEVVARDMAGNRSRVKRDRVTIP